MISNRSLNSVNGPSRRRPGPQAASASKSISLFELPGAAYSPAQRAQTEASLLQHRPDDHGTSVALAFALTNLKGVPCLNPSLSLRRPRTNEPKEAVCGEWLPHIRWDTLLQVIGVGLGAVGSVSVSQSPLPTPPPPLSKPQETEEKRDKGRKGDLRYLVGLVAGPLTSPRHNARVHPSTQASQLTAHANQLTRVAGSAKVPPPSPILSYPIPSHPIPSPPHAVMPTPSVSLCTVRACTARTGFRGFRSLMLFAWALDACLLVAWPAN